MKLALTLDLDTAAAVAARPLDDEALQRKLWIMIARHLITTDGQAGNPVWPPGPVSQVTRGQRVPISRDSRSTCRRVVPFLRSLGALQMAVAGVVLLPGNLARMVRAAFISYRALRTAVRVEGLIHGTWTVWSILG